MVDNPNLDIFELDVVLMEPLLCNERSFMDLSGQTMRRPKLTSPGPPAVPLLLMLTLLVLLALLALLKALELCEADMIPAKDREHDVKCSSIKSLFLWETTSLSNVLTHQRWHCCQTCTIITVYNTHLFFRA